MIDMFTISDSDVACEIRLNTVVKIILRQLVCEKRTDHGLLSKNPSSVLLILLIKIEKYDII